MNRPRGWTRLAAAALAVAATRAAAATPAPPPGRAAPVKPLYWLKTYSTAPHQEYWSGELAVKRLDDDVPRVVKAVDDEGGALTQDLRAFVSSRNPPTQQLTLTVPRARAKALVKRLRKLGTMADPVARELGEKAPVEELNAKIERLTAERKQRGAELARATVAAEIEEEILAHLLAAKEAATRDAGRIRIDLLVRQK